MQHKSAPNISLMEDDAVVDDRIVDGLGKAASGMKKLGRFTMRGKSDDLPQ
jgi:hypothetical protein